MDAVPATRCMLRNKSSLKYAKRMSQLSLLTLVGNIGSGKSTALPLLVKEFEAKPVYADDLFQSTDPFAQLYLQDTPRWAFTNELWLTHQRSLIIKSHLENTENHNSLSIIDSGLLMSWVYTHSHLLVKNITLDEWEFYEQLYDQFSSDILTQTGVVRLRYSIDTLLSRIKKRGRDYELEFYTREYLEQIELGLDALEKKLTTQGVPFVSIDESEIADFEANPQDAKNLILQVKKLVPTK